MTKIKNLTKKDIENNVATNFQKIRGDMGLTIQELTDKINDIGPGLNIKRQAIKSIADGNSVGWYNVYLLSLLTGYTMDEIFTTIIK